MNSIPRRDGWVVSDEQNPDREIHIPVRDLNFRGGSIHTLLGAVKTAIKAKIREIKQMETEKTEPTD
jgi:hypothetical protein